MEQKRKTLIWLDDIRDPLVDNWRVFWAIRVADEDVVWVKDYNEFVAWIRENGLPAGINFDHDLADEHYDPAMYESSANYNEAANNFKEKTGMDAAKWLVNYCMDNGLELPKYYVHSANPVGRENIQKYLYQFKITQS